VLGPDRLTWGVSVFNRPGFEFDLTCLRKLVELLPPPRFEGYQCRSLFRQGMFSPRAHGWWKGMRVETKKGGPMQVKVSSRMIMDLLAGRMTPEQFRHFMGERPGQANLFHHWLGMGYTIKAAKLEDGGIDADDDFLVLTLSDDPAARSLKLKPTEVPALPEGDV
jgi:hypothetical protein